MAGSMARIMPVNPITSKSSEFRVGRIFGRFGSECCEDCGAWKDAAVARPVRTTYLGAGRAKRRFQLLLLHSHTRRSFEVNDFQIGPMPFQILGDVPPMTVMRLVLAAL